MKVSEIGLAAIQSREGVRLTAYRDSVGVWTIGWGHTKGVKQGQKITREQAEAFLREDIDTHAAPAFAAVKVPISQNEADALASIVFNIGVGGFKRSGFLRALNEGRPRAKVARLIMQWTKPPEVTSRREAERDQFLTMYSVRLPKARSNDRSSVKVVGAVSPKPKTISHVPIATDKPVVETVEPVIEALPLWKRLIGVKPQSVVLVGTNKGDIVLFRAQNRLLAAGYTEVGDPDGLWGASTKTAVTLALAEQFPAIKPPDDWPLSDDILASMVKLQRRKVAEARATKTVSELRAEGNTPVKAPAALVGGGILSGLFSILGGVDQTGVLDGIKGTADKASETLSTIQTILTTGIGLVQWVFHHWWILGLLAGIWAAMKGLKYALQIRALYRQGTIRQAGL
ncbi:lysozyme [uncultured Enterovirga sp.]|uniref:lysozyme n=1 Tax=uncultured Enterovirga sp. TaxID=2026352 RepID=UPI0035CAA0C5